MLLSKAFWKHINYKKSQVVPVVQLRVVSIDNDKYANKFLMTFFFAY